MTVIRVMTSGPPGNKGDKGDPGEGGYAHLDVGALTQGSMVLGTLSAAPDVPANLQVYLNGMMLTQTVDYILTDLTVTATAALNVSLGGYASDGQGFRSTDEFKAIY